MRTTSQGRLSRRDFARTAASGASAAWAAWTTVPESLRADATRAAGALRLATFRFDVTPPVGHALCGGWITSVVAVDDPLEANGVVLLGAGAPIVLCAVDWTGLLNVAHLRWRQALAEAAGTTPDRVALHVVHQHNAPFACLDTQRIVAAYPGLPHVIAPAFFAECLQRAQAAVSAAIPRARRITHVAGTSTRVDKIASNRRVARDAANQVVAMRGSATRDAALRAMPEGLIDPDAKTIAFYDGAERVAALHYYATHPMSYYGDGRVTSDFAGLARKRLQAADPTCAHLYFTGCAGNVTAGKYNDGSPAMREVLTGRLHKALAAGLTHLRPVPIDAVSWTSIDVTPLANPSLDAAALARDIATPTNTIVNRNRPAFQLAWLERVASGLPIVISSLRVNDLGLLHLPAEAFVEYQLAAQAMVPGRLLATAAYGDGGPWYIPTAGEYECGGYEVSMAFSDRRIDPTLRDAIRRVLADA